MKSELGSQQEFDDFLAAISKDNARSLRVNTLKTDTEDFIKNNPWGIDESSKIAWCPDGFYFDDEMTPPPGKSPYHSAGVFYIQEASAMSPVMKLDIKPGQKVLDLCAAPGGKSTQIASLMKQKGILISNEPNISRARILSENIERMGIANALVLSHDPSELSDRFFEYFDRILVDAPCSGEGMFRKNPEAINEWSSENVLMCAERQRNILSEAVKMLSPGGRLVYSTCTFSRAEDEENAQWLTDTFDNMTLIEENRIWPHKVRGEGHYFAVFEKTASSFSNEGGIPRSRKDQTIKGIDLKKLPEWIQFVSESLKAGFTSPFASDNDIPSSKYTLFGEELYILPYDFPDMKGLKVLRSGLHLGTLKKNRFEPSFALSMFLGREDVKYSAQIDYDTAERYLKGETFEYSGEKGWYLVTFDGFSLGWGKLSGGIMKNHYPKGLRNL